MAFRDEPQPPAPPARDAMCDHRAIAAAAAEKMSHGSAQHHLYQQRHHQPQPLQQLQHPDNDGVPSSTHLIFSHSTSMEFANSLIREEDADILEQGVEERRGADLADFDDEGRRLEPCSRSESNASLEDQLENEAQSWELNLEGSDRSHCGDDRVSVITGDTAVDESRNDLSPPPSSSASSAIPQHALPSSSANNSMPAIAENTSYHIHHPSLEDNSWPIADIIEPSESLESLPKNSNNTDYFMGETSLAKPQIQKIEEIDHDALARRIASGRANNRSDSFDRRLNESAQFAEAVGEDSLLLNKINEEDSSSDFDDDEIDEEETGTGANNVMLLAEDQVNLMDYRIGVETDEEHQQTSEVNAALELSDQQEQPAGEPSTEKIEPTCVSTDLSHVFLNNARGGTCPHQLLLMSQQQLQQQQQRQQQHQLQENLSQLPLPSTLEVGGADSAQATPAPSPCKAARPFVDSSFHPPPPSYVDWKFTAFTRHHSSSSNMDGNHASRHQTSGEPEHGFVYRGIRSNPPEITKRGMARGNYAQLHRKAWLEVTDRHHRYGKNLRRYYKHWEALGHPGHMFFDWLDSKGEAAGLPLPNLPELPRTVLDSDTVLYITDPEVSSRYALNIVADPADGSAIILDGEGAPIDTGREGWIFILRDHVLYGWRKVTAPGKCDDGTAPAGGVAEAAKQVVPTRQRFHHSSFFGGKAVASAGIFITNRHGRMTQLYPHSGHYRPGEAHMQRALFFFQRHGVELSTFLVDMQQIFKVSRKFAPGADTGKGNEGSTKEKDKNKENNSKIDNDGKQQQQQQQQQQHQPLVQNANGAVVAEGGKVVMKKSKKTDCLHLMCGLEVACFLAHKALMIERGVFHQIHRIRSRVPKESRGSVRFILDLVN